MSSTIKGKLQGQMTPRRSITIVPQTVLSNREKLQFMLLSITTLVAIGIFAQYWFAPQNWQHDPLIFGAWSIIVLVMIGTHITRWSLLPFMRKPPLTNAVNSWRVAVATTFVPDVEPLEMLEKSVDALVALDFPHDTWVLDEGDDDRVQSLCRRKGAFHFTRKHSPQYQTSGGAFAKGSKHGNYNAWLYELAHTKYDIAAAFDPDHVPERKFLSDVVGYFEDSTIGYVQVAQVYGNQAQSWVARGAAEETYDFFSTIQMASYGLGYPIIVGGHNVHRVAALIGIGGFGAHDADDCLTTILYRKAGWKGIYVPKVLARGRCPAYSAAYLTQQRRWARSVLDIKLRVCPGLSNSSPLPERAMSYLHGLNYLLKGLVPVLVLALICISCATGNVPSCFSSALILPATLLAAALALNEAFRQRFFLVPRQEGGIHWRAALLRWAKWPQMVFALNDVLLNRRYSYSITDKSTDSDRRIEWLWPHILACIAIIVCWIFGRQRNELGSTALNLAVVIVIAITITLVFLECFPRRSSGMPNRLDFK